MDCHESKSSHVPQLVYNYSTFYSRFSDGQKRLLFIENGANNITDSFTDLHKRNRVQCILKFKDVLKSNCQLWEIF